jgi:hypothetical protein
MLLAFTGCETAPAADHGYSIPLPRGRIDVTTPADCAARFGVPAPATGGGARLAAIDFAVRDAAVCEAQLARAHIPHLRREHSIVVGPEQGFGATLLFTPAG